MSSWTPVGDPRGVNGNEDEKSASGLAGGDAVEQTEDE